MSLRTLSRPALAALALAAVSSLTPAAHADTAVAWGDNYDFQLGTNLSGNQPSPIFVLDLNNTVTAVASGMNFSFAIQGGAAYAWGYNDNGSLAGATPSSEIYNPTIAKVLTSGVTAIDLGGYHGLAIKNGAVFAWGWNQNYQIGDGTQNTHTTPIRISPLTANCTAVSAGFLYSMAVKSGALYAWGDNTGGCLGDGTTTTRSTPTQISALASNVTAISAGINTSLAIQNGNLFAWGINSNGEVGDGTTSTRLTPTLILSGNVTACAEGYNFSLAVQNGHVYAWGENNDGQLGDGTKVDSHAPELVAGLSNIVQVAAGNYDSYALAADGSLWVWGDNSVGELGLGDYTSSLTPEHLFAPDGYIFTSVASDADSATVLATIALVPEPASLTLLALAAPLLLTRRRKTEPVA